VLASGAPVIDETGGIDPDKVSVAPVVGGSDGASKVESSVVVLQEVLVLAMTVWSRFRT
jgi:hypothetical protein